MPEDISPNAPFETLDAVKRCAVLVLVKKWVEAPRSFPGNNQQFFKAFEREHGLSATRWLLSKYIDYSHKQKARRRDVVTVINAQDTTKSFEALDEETRAVVSGFVSMWIYDPSSYPEEDMEEFNDMFEEDYGTAAKLWLFRKYLEAIVNKTRQTD